MTEEEKITIVTNQTNTRILNCAMLQIANNVDCTIVLMDLKNQIKGRNKHMSRVAMWRITQLLAFVIDGHCNMCSVIAVTNPSLKHGVRASYVLVRLDNQHRATDKIVYALVYEAQR